MQHLGVWNHLEKLALIFLYNFHPEHSLLKLVIKKFKQDGDVPCSTFYEINISQLTRFARFVIWRNWR